MAPIRLGYEALRMCAIKIQSWWPWRALMKSLHKCLIRKKAEKIIFERVIAWREGQKCRDPKGEHAIAIGRVVAMRERRDAVNKATALLQLRARHFLFRLGYLRLCNAAVKLQPIGRAYIVRRRLSIFHKAIPCFQRSVIGFLVKRRMQSLRAATKRLQHFVRNHPSVWKRRRLARTFGAVKFQSAVRIILARNKVKKVGALAQETRRLNSCSDALLLEVEDLQRNVTIANSNFPLIDIDVTEPPRTLEDETWVSQTQRAVELLQPGDDLSDIAMSCDFTLLLSSTGRLCSVGAKPMLVKEGPISRWQLPLKSRIAQLSCGDAHAAMLTERGSILVCGNGDRGQLGRGHFETSSLVAQISAFESHISFRQVSCASFGTVALTNDGSVYSWGMGEVLGQGVYLGDGDTATPAMIRTLAAFRIRQIACGKDFVVALAYHGAVYAWGANDFGEMGPESQLGRLKYMPSQVQGVWPALTASLPIMVACGLKHVAALSADGSVICWGRSDSGQTAVNTKSLNTTSANMVSFPKKNAHSIPQRIASIACGGRQTYAISRDGEVFAFGCISCKPGSTVSSSTAEPYRLPDICLPASHRSNNNGQLAASSTRLLATYSSRGSAAFCGLAKSRSQRQSDNPNVAQLAEATAIDPDVCSMVLLSKNPKASMSQMGSIQVTRRKSSKLPQILVPQSERKTESEILAARVSSFHELHALKEVQKQEKVAQRRQQRTLREGLIGSDFPLRYFELRYSAEVSQVDQEHHVRFEVESFEEELLPHLTEQVVLEKILHLRAELSQAKDRYNEVSRIE